MKEGEVLEFMIGDNGLPVSAMVNHVGVHHIVAIDSDGHEFVADKSVPWRYPPDPIKELREQMLEEWRSHSLDTAHDGEFSQVRLGYFIDWLIEHGYVGVE